MDLYTKIILTIIAICLMLLVFKPATIAPVSASDTLDVNIRAVGGRNIHDAIPIKTVN